LIRIKIKIRIRINFLSYQGKDFSAGNYIPNSRKKLEVKKAPKLHKYRGKKTNNKPLPSLLAPGRFLHLLD